MKSPLNFLKKTYVYDKFGPNPGNMLVVTGLIGWILSSAAQIFAIAINDKISKKEKLFLIPQEMADAVVNAVSFYTLTAGVKNLGKKLTTTGKWRTEKLSKLLERDGHVLKKGAKRLKGKNYVGDWDFDITKLSNYKSELEPFYKPFNNGVEVATGLVGSVLSSNLVTPIFRNYYAARKQKELISLTDKKNTEASQNGTTQIPMPMQKVSFTDYQKLASIRPYMHSGNLKI